MERSINVRVFWGYTSYSIILKVKGNLLQPSTNSNWIYIQVLHSAGREIDANTEHYPKQQGWVTLQASDVAVAFSCLTPRLLTEWTHFPLWLQLLPVAIQLSDPLSPGPGTCSHVLIRHLNPEAQLVFQIRNVQNWTNHFTSKPAPVLPMLFLPSNGMTVSSAPGRKLPLPHIQGSPRREHPAPAIHPHGLCFGPGIAHALPMSTQSVIQSRGTSWLSTYYARHSAMT